MDLYSIGEMVIDFLPYEKPGVYERNAGGAPANVAIAAARQGMRAGFCGMLGNDDFGHFLAGVLEENGVELLSGEMTDEAVTTMAFVSLTEDGERSFTFARKPGADMLLEPRHVRREHIGSARIVCAGSCALSKPPQSQAVAYALSSAKESGRITAFDVNYRSLMWKSEDEAAKAVYSVLPDVDLLKLSEDEVFLVGGRENIGRLMREYRIALIALTLGADGVCCYWNGTEFHACCPDVNRVDTTGAGDAFWGTFLASLIRAGVNSVSDLDSGIIRMAMREGNAAGTLCVQKKGAIASLPSYDAILDCLKEGGFD